MIPALEVKRSGPGHPASTGDRYKCGKLRPPVHEAVLRRRELLQDPTYGDNPLEAAYAAGWLTKEHLSAARSYLKLWRIAYDRSVGPRLAQTSLPEVELRDVKVSGYRIGNWSKEQITHVWDLVFGEGAPDPSVRIDANAKAAEQLKAVHAAMTEDERTEVVQVCVRESWPQWFIQRSSAKAITDRAIAENRACTDDELARIYKRKHSSFERKRDHLIRGLNIVMRAMNPEAAPATFVAYDESTIEAVRHAPGPDTRGFERTDYVDGGGNLRFVAERKRPIGA